MDIIFFGSGKFAVPSLKALLNSRHKVSCVVTQPDRKKGRHLLTAATEVKETAVGFGVKIFQPENINTSASVTLLEDLNPDLFVVSAYGQILSQRVLDIPGILPVNIHASILPKYRGAAPINWAIINGDEVTGVSVIKMAKEMDAGPIILQKATDITPDDTAVSLEDRLAKIAAQLLSEAITCIENNNYNLLPQDSAKISFAPKLKRKDGEINWEKPAQEIHNLVRGCLDWPGAFTYYKGKLLKVYKTRLDTDSPSVSALPGEITGISLGAIAVFTGKGVLTIEELQIEGKRRMAVSDFIQGYKIRKGDVLGQNA